MRLLDDEETGKIIFKTKEQLQELAGSPREYNMAEFVTFSKDTLEELLKAQYQLDLKGFVGDLEYRGEGCDCMGERTAWIDAEWFILPIEYLQSLKQLVEE